MGEILKGATGKTAKQLIEERLFSKIGLKNYTAWEDSAGNTLTYCCLDMSARDYSRFGILFSRNGNWNGEQVISKNYVDESLKLYWGSTPSMGWAHSDTRGYSLQWWISKYDDQAKIYNTSGKFGQFVFLDKERDIIKKSLIEMGANLRFLIWIGLIDIDGGSVGIPYTEADGESKEFYENYVKIVERIADLEKDDG